MESHQNKCLKRLKKEKKKFDQSQPWPEMLPRCTSVRRLAFQAKALKAVNT